MCEREKMTQITPTPEVRVRKSESPRESRVNSVDFSDLHTKPTHSCVNREVDLDEFLEFPCEN
jgi:hypothetical protein